jgi:CRP-like cAMP-binding protein
LRIFGGVTDAQLATILKKMELWILETGEAVFRKGDDPMHIYIVKSGRIDLQLCENGAVIHKHELHAGECFGEASLMCIHRHTATAVAAADSEILVLPKRALIELRHENVELFALLIMNIARELARRLYLTDELLLAASAKGAGVSPL